VALLAGAEPPPSSGGGSGLGEGEPAVRARQAQKMEAIGRLAGGIAHDFNNLLTVINGYSDWLMRSLPPGDPSLDLLGEIHKAGQRAAGLTRQLLAFSRKAGIEPRLIDLRALVADAGRMLRRIVGEDVELTVAADPAAGAVRADPSQMEQVILNLVVNARDAMPQGGRLGIEVRNAEYRDPDAPDRTGSRPGQYVLLSVSDTGVGMDAATRARAFEPFFTTKGERGTGLGLATVHEIVRQCGGHVAVESEVGRGTTFSVYLPRAAGRAPTGLSHPGTVALPRASGTVLLIEDEDSVRALVRHVLTGCGYAVIEARGGEEAVELASAHRDRLDLLVSDVVLPDLGAREVAERVTVSHPEAKVLFVSGYTPDAVARHGGPEAGAAFLQKPFAPATLAAKVRELIEGGPV
jgi:CheY-like chemotaxis protein